VIVRLASLAAIVVAAATCSSSSSSSGPLSLTASAKTAPADGITLVSLSADVDNAPAGGVLSFTVDGVGLLAETNAKLIDGRATASIWAPFESDLGNAASATAKITATASWNPALTATTSVVFTIPDTGAPELSAHATPDRVVAGGPDPITIVVDGRRLSSSTVTLTASPTGVVQVPPTLTLDASGHGSIAIDPPANPADVTVDLSDGVATANVVLHFIANDAPAFDLSGTFAEVQYGVVEIGGLVFLSPDPQCVIAPTLLLTKFVQTGTHVTITTTTCNVEMPSVSVVLVGESTTTVGPGFVDATNARSTGPLEADFTNDGTFTPTQPTFGKPLVVGAELANPATDDLPTTPDDPRVRDDDHDGNPGVTVTNSTEGPQYTVFRTITSSMTGTISSSDAIDGMVAGNTETNLLNGGSGGLSPTVTGKPSPFSFRRVDGKNGTVDISGRDGDPSSISCDDVNAFASELEQLAPPPDTSTACN
jgi:hypothetical protein